MEIKTSIQDDIMIITIGGRLDAVSSPDFDKQMDGFISQGNKNFVLDLSSLDYISSAGLRSVLSASKKLKAEGGSLALASLKDVVKEVFDISGFTKIIPIYDSVESAISGIK
jgi:anti-anti-sigma factor